MRVCRRSDLEVFKLPRIDAVACRPTTGCSLAFYSLTPTASVLQLDERQLSNNLFIYFISYVYVPRSSFSDKNRQNHDFVGENGTISATSSSFGIVAIETSWEVPTVVARNCGTHYPRLPFW